MPVIELKIMIDAPIERVFDLARSVDLHIKSTSKTNEQAVGGRTTGLIELGELVTWKANHFGIKQELTSKVVAYDRPVYFRDSMQKGAFSRFDHQHFFEEIDGVTMMRDVFDYNSPYWIFGYIADKLFLKGYIKRLLLERNEMIKNVAESEGWKVFL